MSIFRTYFSLERKKNRRAIPGMLIGLAILFAFGGFLLFSLSTQNNAKEASTVVGIVAEEDEPYIDLFMSVLKNTETLKDSYKFILLSEEDAQKKFDKGEVSVVFIMPKNYINRMIAGDISPIKIQFGSSDVTLPALLMRQLSGSVSRLLLDTYAGIYAMDEYYNIHQLPDREKANYALNVEYIKKILARHSAFEAITIESENGMHYSQYYFTVILLLLLFFLGLIAPKVFHPENKTFAQKLQLAGLSSHKQLLCRQLASWLLFGSFFLGLVLIFTAVVTFGPYKLPNFSQETLGDWLTSLLPIVLVIPLVCALLGFIYECIPDLTASILFLFLSILLLGYLSGYFYPIAFLPKLLQHLSAFLPTRIAFQYASSCVCQNLSIINLCKVLGETILLLAVTSIIRKRRMEMPTR